MAAGDLTTIESVRAYLKGQVPVPVDDETTLIPGLITAVSKMFASETGCPILNTEQPQTWNGDGGTKVYLEQYPVVSVESVEVDGEVVAERPRWARSGWVLTNADAGKLELVGFTFAEGTANCVGRATRRATEPRRRPTSTRPSSTRWRTCTGEGPDRRRQRVARRPAAR